MGRILYSWEHGSGYGHATKMKNVCKCITNHDILIAGKQLDKVQQYFSYRDLTEIYQSPYIEAKANDEYSNAVTYSQMLMLLSGSTIDQVSFLVKSWKNLIEKTKPDILLSDFSPMALLVAQSLGIKTKAIGTGYEIPSYDGYLPSLIPWNPEDQSKVCIESDDKFLNLIEIAFRNNNITPPTDLSGLTDKSESLFIIPKGMDHFDREGGNFQNFRFIERGMDDGKIWETYKPKVFFFLKGVHERVLETLINLRYEFEIRGVISNLTNTNRDFLRNKGLFVYNSLIDLEEVLPQTDLIIFNGGINTLKKVGLYNTNSIIIPAHGEQRLTAYRMAIRGATTVFDPTTNTHVRFEDVIRDTIKSDKADNLHAITSDGLITDYHEELAKFIEY